METIELNSSADPEQNNVILMPRTHTHSRISSREWKGSGLHRMLHLTWLASDVRRV